MASWSLKESFVKRMRVGANTVEKLFFGKQDPKSEKKYRNGLGTTISKERIVLEHFATKGEKLLMELADRARHFKSLELDASFKEIKDHFGLYQCVTEVFEERNSNTPDLPVFIISSQLIYEAYRQLGTIKTESILYASGSRVGRFNTVERLIPLELDSSRYGYASANLDHSTKVLIGIDEFGSVLSAYFHMHPGNGSNANFPSDIDIANHERLERGGFITIGGIFSRDGHLRFFSDKSRFEIEIAGTEVTHVDKENFKLTKV